MVSGRCTFNERQVNIVKMALVAATALLVSGSSGLAETCEETFVRVMTDRVTDKPVRIHVTQEIVGGMASKNWNYQDGKGNWMTEMIEPETMAWSMVRDNVMYSSADKGQTWQKIRDVDEQDPEETARLLAERGKTVRNAVCGQDEIDGVAYETVAADYNLLGDYDAEVHDIFWIDPETGFVPKLETRMKGDGFESVTVQLVEDAPDLVLPTPD